MNAQLIEIQPRELKFFFVLKKQNACFVRLTNNTPSPVAFKVKTTSPKKYCVRPNVGIILPKSTSEFTVTMQAQATAPPDMMCKDKFLIQSTIVPIGTTDKDITSSMFAKDNGRYVQEDKLRVTLVSPTNSPVLSPINGTSNPSPINEASVLKDPVLSKSENRMPTKMDAENVEELKAVNSGEFKTAKIKELKPENDVISSNEQNPSQNEELDLKRDAIDDEKLKPANHQRFQPREIVIDDKELMPAPEVVFQEKKNIINDEELQAEKKTKSNLSKGLVNDEELQPTRMKEMEVSKEVEFKTTNNEEEKKLVKDIEVMKSKLNELESKLREAEVTISKLGEERRLSFQESKLLKGEVEMLRSKAVVKRVQVGYPLLFVCMVAIISFLVGSRLVS